MSKVLSVTLFVIFWSGYTLAQTPLIQSIDKDHGSMGEVVTIKGNNFGSSAAQLDIFFGAVKATSILSATDHVIQVHIPEGASYDNISVYRKDTKLTGFSTEQFFIDYSGTTDPITSGDFDAQIDVSTKSGSTSSDLYNLCSCDFNNDGKPDVVTAHNNANYITLLRNTSTIGTYSFVRTDINLDARTIHINCGDLNNDGLYDIVATEFGTEGKVFFLKGNGSGGFAAPQTITLNSLVRYAQIADMDLDGKPEVILSNKSNNEVIILPNTSSTNISFGTPVRIIIAPIRKSDGTDALVVEDINNDNAPDIIVSPTQTANVYVLKNKSTLNNFQFEAPITLAVPGIIISLKAGDLDNDGKPEIAVTKFTGNQVAILKNTSTNDAISFNAPINAPTELSGSWGLDFGDLNGDGRPDIVVGHTDASDPGSTPPKSRLTVLENKGGLAFQKIALEKNEVTRYVKIVDMDKDGKPDIAGVSIDKFIQGRGVIEASKVFVLRNKRCVKPEVSPEGPVNVCSGDPVVLTGTQGGGISYKWLKNNVDMPGEVTHTLSLTANDVAGSNYKMVIPAIGACPDLESNEVHVKIASAGSFTDSPPMTPDPSPACAGAGNQVKLQATASGGDLQKYKWEGPDFNPPASTDPIAIVGGPGVGLSLKDAGYYTVSYLGPGDCVLKKSAPVLVNIIATPLFKINRSAGDTICVNGSTSLSVFPSSSGYDYQWFKRNNDNSSTAVGTLNQPFAVDTEGKYFARISVSGGLCTIDVEEVTIKQRPELTASFSGPIAACTTQEIKFTNNTVEAEPLKYSWSFGDNRTSVEKSPKHTYTSASDASGFEVTLKAMYADGTCPDEVEKSIRIHQAPALKINTATEKNQLCKDGELELSVAGATITNYKWSTNETTPTIKADSAKSYKVTVTTSTGCILDVKTELTFFPNTTVDVSVSPSSISAGETAQLNASGITDYRWSPAETLSDSTIANPIASPMKTTTYTVKGIDTNGCKSIGTIALEVAFQSTVNLLSPKNFFSPNGDETGNQWVVGNIQNFPACGVAVYDEKGVKVFEARPYNNDWEGTFNGNSLPNGVYYYIIRCEGEEKTPRTGSITLLR